MHKLLPRTLAYLAEDTTSAESDTCFTRVEEWLSECGLVEADGDGNGNHSVANGGMSEGVGNGQNWQTLLMDIIDTKELSFSDLNRKRKRLTFQAFQEPLIIARTIAMEALVSPNVHKMHKLFQRSDAIATLQRLPASATCERAKCKDDSESIFTLFASGHFGLQLIMEYVQRLQAFPHLGVPEVALDFFKLALSSVGDHWRRLILPTKACPWTLIHAAIESEDMLLLVLEQMKQLKAKCHHCLDVEFTHVLLDFLPDDLQGSCARERVEVIRRFVKDLAVYAPLSSDLVECLHGFSQHLLHRWRGCKPTDSVAQERSMWASIVRSFAKLKKFLWDRYMDRRSRTRMERFGTKPSSRNQYTSTTQKRAERKPRRTRPPMTLETIDKMVAFGQGPCSLPKARKLCGDLPSFAVLARGSSHKCIMTHGS